MRPGDRLVCSFVEDIEENARFKDWPLHVTIVPWFRAKESNEELSEGIKKVLASSGPFTAKAAGSDHFGYRKSKEVRLITLPSPYVELENKVRSFLKSLGAWIVDETTKRRHEFRPHVTVQRNRRLGSGDTFMCSHVYIIEQLGKEKIVSAKVRLEQ